MEYKEAITYLLFITQGLAVYLFRKIEQDINEDIKKVELDVASLKEQHSNQLLINLTLENNINNYKRDIEGITKSVTQVQLDISKLQKDLHDLIGIVNNKTMEKQYAEKMMAKIDKIMEKIDEKN
jgi:septal ring factor EnvC (AmiA/AmiB activator)